MIYLLLAAQAAGMAGQAFGQHRAYQTSKVASQIEQQQLDLRLEQEVLSAQEQASFRLEQLEGALSSQRAFFGAKGQDVTRGGARAAQAFSLRQFGKDERAASLNLKFTKEQIKLAKRLETQKLKGLKPNYLALGFKGGAEMGSQFAMGGFKESK